MTPDSLLVEALVVTNDDLERDRDRWRKTADPWHAATRDLAEQVERIGEAARFLPHSDRCTPATCVCSVLDVRIALGVGP